jgi:hypothetical protein
MLKLTTAENNVLRPWLIDRMCTGGDVIEHKDLAEELDPNGSLGWNDGGDYNGLSHALFHVATFEVEHGRPVGLVALAIDETKQLAEGGFPKMARALLFDVPEDAGP